MQLDDLPIRIIFTGNKLPDVPEKNPAALSEKG
jgi:hypothetical protein